MGASESHPVGDGAHKNAPLKALHILRVSPGSPASATDIEPFFDFVVSVDQISLAITNVSINPWAGKALDAHDLESIVEEREGQPLDLIVWSSKSEVYRKVKVTPSRDWSTRAHAVGEHSRRESLVLTSHSRSSSSASVGPKPSLLGLSMRVCEPSKSLENVWHILDVMEGSPAESAGLVPYGDWIVGWSGGVLRNENDFLEVVEAHVEKPLRVYVYSHDFSTLREVVLVPNRMWGGEGLLGCGVGYGLLHRIPQGGAASPHKAAQEAPFAYGNAIGSDDIIFDSTSPRASLDMNGQQSRILSNPFLDHLDVEHPVPPTNSHALQEDAIAALSSSRAPTPKPRLSEEAADVSEESVRDELPSPSARAPMLPLGGIRQFSNTGAGLAGAAQFGRPTVAAKSTSMAKSHSSEGSMTSVDD